MRISLAGYCMVWQDLRGLIRTLNIFAKRAEFTKVFAFEIAKYLKEFEIICEIYFTVWNT